MTQRSRDAADTEWLVSTEQAISTERENEALPEEEIVRPASGEERRSPATGTVLDGRYRLLRKLGSGGTSSVYLAEHLSLGNLWAVKILSGTDDANDVHMKEASILKRLNHPMLPRIADILMHEGNLCIIMDYVQGRNLVDRLREEGPISEAEVRGWMLQLCDVLAYLHGQKPEAIIYRDLKPANLMADAHGHLKLVDFGTARAFRPGEGDDTSYIGTQGYASPEQYGLTQSDIRTDLYNLGMTMFHLLTNVHPISVPHGEIEKCLQERNVSSHMTEVILTCVQLSPSHRYQNVGACRMELLGETTGLDAASVAPVHQEGGSVRQQFRPEKSALERIQGMRHRQDKKVEGQQGFQQEKKGLGVPVPVQSRIAVLGVSQGAGATFVSIVLAAFFAMKRRHPAIAELNATNDFLQLRVQLEQAGHHTEGIPESMDGQSYRFRDIVFHPACRRLTDIRGPRSDVVIMDLGSLRTENAMDEFRRADLRFVYCPQADWKFHHVITFLDAVDNPNAPEPFLYLLPHEERLGAGMYKKFFGNRRVLTFPYIRNPFDPSPAECRQLERVIRAAGLAN